MSHRMATEPRPPKAPVAPPRHLGQARGIWHVEIADPEVLADRVLALVRKAGRSE